MRVVGAIFGTLALIVVELVLTILVYTSLNIYHFDLFGRLVRLASGVLDAMLALVSSVFSGGADTAYASLFGELGPKAMLLLLIGLVVAAVMRLLVWSVRMMVGNSG